jgi:hypothetical protein
MKSCHIALAFCAVALIGSLAADSAVAQDGYGGFGGYGYSGYSRYGNRGYVHANRVAPPYFAHNPPVYYGKVRPRDYGWSPYPYGPSGSFARSASPAPAAPDYRWAMSRGNEKRIRNPYIDGGSTSPSDVKVEDATTGIIRNPYVDEPLASNAER